jgi:hypothetical protein
MSSTAKKSLTSLMARAAGAATLALAAAAPAQANMQDVEDGRDVPFSVMSAKLARAGHDIVMTGERFGATDQYKGLFLTRKPDGSEAYILATNHPVNPTIAKVYMKLDQNVKIFRAPLDSDKTVPRAALSGPRDENEIAQQCAERIRNGHFREGNCYNHNKLLTEMAQTYMKPIIQGDTVIQFPNAPTPERVRVTVVTRASAGTGMTRDGSPDGAFLISAGRGTTMVLGNMSPHRVIITEAGVRQAGMSTASGVQNNNAPRPN